MATRAHLGLLLMALCASPVRAIDSCINQSVTSPQSFSFFPNAEVKLKMLETRKIYGTVEVIEGNFTYIVVTSDDNEIMDIVGNSTLQIDYIDCTRENTSVLKIPQTDLPTTLCLNVSVIVHGVFIGRTNLHVVVPGRPLPAASVRVVVIREVSLLTQIFTYSIITMVAINTVGFGCSINLQEMKAIIKRPISPIIGLCCQFILNPLLAYSVGLLCGLGPSLALGLFALGCCPGGGGSNMWTFLLDGDLDLSILMTFSSTMVSFGMLPLWMYTLGSTLVPDSLQLPFANIFYSLIGLAVPATVGVLISKYAPKVAAKIRKIIKPMMILCLLVIFSIGIYSNLYMFELMNSWRVLVAGFSLPYSAYFTSACVATILRRPRKHVLTISIETAIQNTGIAIVLILTTFPQPDADIAAVMPIVAVMFTPLPLVCLLIIKTIRLRLSKPNEKKIEEKTDVDNGKAETPSLGEKMEINKGHDSVVTDDKDPVCITSVA